MSGESNSFTIAGAEGPIEVPAGEFYFNTKARYRRMMREHSLSLDALRVYACLEMATMGFQSELAVVMDGGERRPLRSTDIQLQTGLSRQNVRRAIAELEHNGLAERRSADGGSLRAGQILLYSWSAPRAPKVAKNVVERDYIFPSWFPSSWEPLKPVINRLKLKLSIDEVVARDYIYEGENAAIAYQHACDVVERFLKRVCAQPISARSNKEERTERTKRKEHHLTGGRAEKGVPIEQQEAQPEEPPARPLAVDSPPHPQNPKTQTAWDSELRRWMQENCPVGTFLDSLVFGRIARWLSPATLPQFQEAVLAVRSPRKWAIYEEVAKQVAARGKVKSAEELSVERASRPRFSHKAEAYARRVREEEERRRRAS